MKSLLLGPLLLAVLLLAGCSPPPNQQGSQSPPSGTGGATSRAGGTRGPVALVVKTLANPFFLTMRDGAMRAGQEEGIEVRAQAPAREGDIARQTEILSNDIAQGFKVLLVAPADSKAVVPVLKRANQANIPIINVDNRIDPAAAREHGLKIARYIGADNEEGGRMAGQELARLLNGQGVVAMLEGIPGVDNAEARKRGFLAAMKTHPQIKVVDSRSAHWEADEASRVFANMLQAHPEIQGVFCANDNMALGAIRALKNAQKKPGQIKVVAYDNIGEAQDALREGWLQGTVDQKADQMGYEAVKAASKLLKGETVPSEDLLVKLELVTPESLKAGGTR